MRSIFFSGLIVMAGLLAAQNDGVTQPSLIYRSEPEYSAEATRARVQSSVMLSIIVGEDGRAHDIKVTHGAGFGLDEKAIEAMDQWRFNPATRDGHPAAVPANIEMNFSILARNDPEDHTGQQARLNFTLPPGATRPELVAGKLPANPAAPGKQALRFHLQVDAQGAPKNVSALSSTDPAWEKQVLRVVQTWRFQPATMNGSAVQVEGIFEFEHDGAAEPAISIVMDKSNAVGDEALASRPAPAPLPVSGLSPRSQHTATVLPNGTVLLAGGAAHVSELPPGSNDFHSLSSAQIFDWATRRIANSGEMLTARSRHTATLLRDGTVLIVGGYGTQPIASAEIFDPSTGKFSSTGSLHEARESHVAAILPDGRVLVCGGTGAGNKYLVSAEIYDPRTKLFSTTGNMTVARTSFRSIVLKDGRILVAGGFGAAGGTVEIYDPARGDFRAAGSMAAPRYGFSATLLETGKILIAGGSAGSAEGPASPTSEIFDPATSSFQASGPMSLAREFHEALLMKNGKVLISGGIPGSPGTPVAPTEIFDPVSGTFTPGPVLSGRHTGHTSTLLQDGSVLVVGSGLIGNGGSAELLMLK